MKTESDKSISTSSWQGMFALMAAIGASLCCVAPLVLLSLGIGGAWVSTLTTMEPLRPFFILLSLLFIGLGYRQIYIIPNRCAEKASCAIPNIAYRQRLMFWLSSAFILILLIFTQLAPLFMT